MSLRSSNTITRAPGHRPYGRYGRPKTPGPGQMFDPKHLARAMGVSMDIPEMEMTDRGLSQNSRWEKKRKCINWKHGEKKCALGGEILRTMGTPWGKQRHHCRICGRAVCDKHWGKDIQIFPLSIQSNNTYFSIKACSECSQKEDMIIEKMKNEYPNDSRKDIIGALRQAMMENIVYSFNKKKCWNIGNKFLENEITNQQYKKLRKICSKKFCKYNRLPTKENQERARVILNSNKGVNPIFLKKIGGIWEVDRNLFPQANIIKKRHLGGKRTRRRKKRKSKRRRSKRRRSRRRRSRRRRSKRRRLK